MPEKKGHPRSEKARNGQVREVVLKSLRGFGHWLSGGFERQFLVYSVFKEQGDGGARQWQPIPSLCFDYTIKLKNMFWLSALGSLGLGKFLSVKSTGWMPARNLRE